MEQIMLRQKEKLEQTLGAHVGQVNAAGRFNGVMDITGVFRYLAEMPLKDWEVSLLFRYPFLQEAALTCWKRDCAGRIRDLRFILVRKETDAVRPMLMAGVRLPSSYQESSRKRREMLTGSQQTLYGGVCIGQL